MNQRTYFVITGKAIDGKWKNKYVVVGSLKENILCESKEEADGQLKRAITYLSNLPKSDIDLSTLQVSLVTVAVDNLPVTRIDF